MGENLLEVRNLKTYFYTYGGVVKALEGVNLKIGKEESLGIVGETGCGKSVTSLSILRLIPQPPGKIEGGEVNFNGRDLLKLSDHEMREQVRGKEISMIFQEPVPALNPVMKVGRQIGEVFEYREKLNKKEALKGAVESLAAVNIADPDRIVNRYPHELSGGMAQRVMIAMAIACHPLLLIADEPTTSLDVTVQAQILDLIRDLMNKIGASLMMITHDLGIIAETCQKVAVMYAGQVVEYADVRTVFKNPQHPYTIGLIGAIPSPGRKKELSTIRGNVPNLIHPPSGCRFYPRCDYAEEICSKEAAQEIEVAPGHIVACHRALEVTNK